MVGARRTEDPEPTPLQTARPGLERVATGRATARRQAGSSLATSGRRLGAAAGPGERCLGHRTGPRGPAPIRCVDAERSCLSAGRGLSSANPIPRWIVVCPPPHLAVSALLQQPVAAP